MAFGGACEQANDGWDCHELPCSAYLGCLVVSSAEEGEEPIRA